PTQQGLHPAGFVSAEEVGRNRTLARGAWVRGRRTPWLERPRRAQRLQAQGNDLLDLGKARRYRLPFRRRPALGELASQRGPAMEELDFGRHDARVLQDPEREAQLARRLRPALDLWKRPAVARQAAQFAGSTHGLELLADSLVEGPEFRPAASLPVLIGRAGLLIRTDRGRRAPSRRPARRCRTLPVERPKRHARERRASAHHERVGRRTFGIGDQRALGLEVAADRLDA